jgi:hypothetical protein
MDRASFPQRTRPRTQATKTKTYLIAILPFSAAVMQALAQETAFI